MPEYEEIEVLMDSPYYMFVASLPTFPVAWESARILPVSPVRLEGRLDNLLTKDDHDTVHFFERTLFGFNFDADEVFLDKIDDLMQQARKISSQLTEACAYLIETRLLIGLIRRSIKGKSLPENFEERWAVHLDAQLVEAVTENWARPDFGLRIDYPWIEKMRQYIESDQALQSENFLNQMLWRKLSDIDFHSGFDMSAAILYVFRWHVMRQRISHMPEESLEIINEQIEAIVGHTEIDYNEC
ncbi:MAG: hypothetical protein ACLFP8_01695 [Alphaproteobacteria bacterium]